MNTVFHYIPLHSSPFGKLKATTKSTMYNTNMISNTLLRLFIIQRRLSKNLLVRLCYKIIIFLRIKKILTYLYPISLTPYLIIKIKKI
jgi:hypothetical protein